MNKKESVAVEMISVTQDQFDRIEAAWEICSFGNHRKASGTWARTFGDCVAQVLGFAPEANFGLKVVQ